MKVSIIVPIYNVEQYIKECLESIYDGNLSDFEVICIDDRGKDNSIEIVKQFVIDNKIDNLSIIQHEQNKGLSEARNTGIKLAKGEYIVFVDSDDMIIARNLNSLIDHAKANNLDIIEGEIEEIYETELDIKVDSAKERSNTDILSGSEYFSYTNKNSEYAPMVWCRAYKTEYIRDNYFFEPNLKFEDEQFSPRVIIGAKKVQYMNQKIYVYRRRDNSITTNIVKDSSWMKHYFRIIESLSEYLQTIEDKETYNALKDRIDNLVLSLIKNPIAYEANDDVLNETINIIKEKKIYRLPIKSKNLFIKLQGFLMMYPKLFILLYKTKGKK